MMTDEERGPDQLEVPPPIEVPPTVAIQVQVQLADGLILAAGWFPGGSPDAETIEIVDLDAEQADVLSQPGTKYWDGSQVSVVPVSAASKAAQLREQRLAAELADAAERLAQQNPEYAVILKASGGIV